MKTLIIYLSLLLVAVGLLSCSAGKKNLKSTEYYNQNKYAIEQLRSYYDSLYRQQAFSVGFTDKTFTYYVMEVTTDTLRSIFNTEQSEQQLFRTISKFNYDTALLRKLAVSMKDIKCLWLDKASFYLNEKKETVTFLSFKSKAIENPFVENKYYVLLLLPHPINTPGLQAKVKKGDLVKIDELVYFTIGNRFR